jgi:hypothetical protein
LVIGLEALALVVAACVVVEKAITGHPAKWWSPYALALLIVVGALVLFLAARSLVRLSGAARTPIVVLQLLALPVSYSLAFQAGLVDYGGPILVAALTVLYLLFTPPARAALDRVPD